MYDFQAIRLQVLLSLLDAHVVRVFSPCHRGLLVVKYVLWQLSHFLICLVYYHSVFIDDFDDPALLIVDLAVFLVRDLDHVLLPIDEGLGLGDVEEPQQVAFLSVYCHVWQVWVQCFLKQVILSIRSIIF